MKSTEEFREWAATIQEERVQEMLTLAPAEPGSVRAIFDECRETLKVKTSLSRYEIGEMFWKSGLMKASIEFAPVQDFCKAVLADEPQSLRALKLWERSEQARHEMNEKVWEETMRMIRSRGIDFDAIPDAEQGSLINVMRPLAHMVEPVEHLRGIYRARIEDAEAAFDQWIKEWKRKRTPKPSKAANYPIQTSQEMDAWHRAQCAGKTFAGYSINDQAGSIIHHLAGLSHQIRLELTEQERAAGLKMSYLENLVRAQDADAALATAYILGVLTPPPHLPARPYAGGWIDFDDAIKKIGWYPQTTKERREMHARIWEFVRFGERAHIVGKRTGAKYQDKHTGLEIDTTIHGAAWRVMKTETPDPLDLNAPPETPVRVEIVVSKELTALLTGAAVAQHLKGAEILGSIPGGKPAGAWARVIGLALGNFWRRKSREIVAGTLDPTRREMLDHYAAKVAPYDEVLKSPNPSRVIDYWCGALQILADGGFIERAGEAALTPQEMKKDLPRKGWQGAWLDQTVNIAPSAAVMMPHVVERAKALPALKPRDLKKKSRKKKQPKKS